MNKKGLIFLSSAFMVLSLASCGGDTSTNIISFYNEVDDRYVLRVNIDDYDTWKSQLAALEEPEAIKRDYYTYKGLYSAINDNDESFASIFDYGSLEKVQYSVNFAPTVKDDSGTLVRKVTLHYLPIEYTITYQGIKEGDKFDNKIETYNIKSSDKLPAVTREGYRFLGWTLDGVAIDALPTSAPKNITLVAKFEEITYYNVYVYTDNRETYKQQTIKVDVGSTIADFKKQLTDDYATKNPDPDKYWFLTRVYMHDEIKGGSSSKEYDDNYIIDKDIKVHLDWNLVSAISTKEQFLYALSSTGYYYLKNDISFESEALEVINEVKSHIDGKNHAIKEFTVNYSTPAVLNIGWIKTLTGSLSNITFKDFTAIISGKVHADFNHVPRDGNISAALLVNTIEQGAYLDNVNLEDAVINATLTSAGTRSSYNQLFGLYAANNKGSIRNCTVEDNVSFTYADCFQYGYDSIISGKLEAVLTTRASGFVGENNGTISNCVLKNDITQTITGEQVQTAKDTYSTDHMTFGGLVATNNGKVIHSAVLGKVDAIQKMIHYSFESTLTFGGLIAVNNGNVINSYIETSYEDYEEGHYNLRTRTNYPATAGGLIGVNEEKGVVNACLIKGYLFRDGVEADSTMGLFAAINKGNISNSLSAGKVDMGNNSALADMTLNTGGFVGVSTSTSIITKSIASATVLEYSKNHKVGRFVDSSARLYNKCYCYANSVIGPEGAIAVELPNGVSEKEEEEKLYQYPLLVTELAWDKQGYRITGGNWPTIA